MKTIAGDEVPDFSLRADEVAAVRRSPWFGHLRLRVPETFGDVSPLCHLIEAKADGRLPSVTCFDDRQLDVFCDLESGNDYDRARFSDFALAVGRLVGVTPDGVALKIGVVQDKYDLLEGEYALPGYAEIRHL